MNIFINLILVITTLVPKLTCLRKVFILYISRSTTFLRYNLNRYIVLQSFRTILLLNTSEASFFTKSLCIFAILSIIALNFPKTSFKKKIFKLSLKVLKGFAYFCIHCFCTCNLEI